MFGLVEEFYGDENPKMQTKVHPNNLNLRLQKFQPLQQFMEMYTWILTSHLRFHPTVGATQQIPKKN